MQIDTQALAELLSLGMTVPTIVLAMAVVWKWWPAARSAFGVGRRTADQWFILGVTAGFIGSVADNLYYTLPWTASFTGHAVKEDLFAAGVYVNVVFRQGLGIAAAYCHLKASELTESKTARWVNRLVVMSYVLGVVYCVGLIALAAGR